MPQKKKKRKPRSRARGASATVAAQPKPVATAASPEKRRERIEARREAKAQAAMEARRRQLIARVTRLVVIVGVAAGIIWFLFLRNSIPDAIAGHEIEHFDPFISESRANTLHTDDTVSYASDPPVSGEHSPIPANCGVHDTQMRNENMVHALEHGAVGILYSPEADPEVIKNIESIVEGYDSHVFSQPYAELDPPFAVLAWAHMMRLDSFDEAATREFIDFFRQAGDSPEEQECPMAAANPFGATPTPGPTTTATPGATPGAGDGGGDEGNNNDQTKKQDEKKKKNNN